MLNQALGTIETVGLCAAFEAADVACKSANVELVGYELTRGFGMVTVKLLGQVSAVNMAVAAAKVAAARVNIVVSTSVIPRPNSLIEKIVLSAQTKGLRWAPEHASADDGKPAQTPPEPQELTARAPAPPRRLEHADSDADPRGADQMSPGPQGVAPHEPSPGTGPKPVQRQRSTRSRPAATKKENPK